MVNICGYTAGSFLKVLALPRSSGSVNLFRCGNQIMGCEFLTTATRVRSLPSRPRSFPSINARQHLLGCPSTSRFEIPYSIPIFYIPVSINPLMTTESLWLIVVIVFIFFCSRLQLVLYYLEIPLVSAETRKYCGISPCCHWLTEGRYHRAF